MGDTFVPHRAEWGIQRSNIHLLGGHPRESTVQGGLIHVEPPPWLLLSALRPFNEHPGQRGPRLSSAGQSGRRVQRERQERGLAASGSSVQRDLAHADLP